MEEYNNILQSKKTILIVDDEQHIVDILTYNLQKEGYNTLEANDGLKAVEIALEKKPDIIRHYATSNGWINCMQENQAFFKYSYFNVNSQRSRNRQNIRVRTRSR